MQFNSFLFQTPVNKSYWNVILGWNTKMYRWHRSFGLYFFFICHALLFFKFNTILQWRAKWVVFSSDLVWCGIILGQSSLAYSRIHYCTLVSARSLFLQLFCMSCLLTPFPKFWACVWRRDRVKSDGFAIYFLLWPMLWWGEILKG